MAENKVVLEAISEAGPEEIYFSVEDWLEKDLKKFLKEFCFFLRIAESICWWISERILSKFSGGIIKKKSGKIQGANSGAIHAIFSKNIFWEE